MADSQKKFSIAKIAEIAVTLMLILVILLCILCVMQVSSKGYVQIFGYSFFRVATGSMEPTLPVGTLLITQEMDIESIQTEDIICFRSKDSQMLGRVITHRVVQVMDDMDGSIRLLTKGDANLAADGYYVTADNFIGRVIWNSEEGGVATAAMSILNSQTGFLLCIVFPVLLIGSFLLRSSIRQIREGIDEAIAELEAEKKEPVTVEISDEEYQEMYERVKQQLMQELEHGEIAYESTSTSEAGAGQEPEAEKV